jgi:glycosyltransferase involved in cell wall biosynthesis
VAVNLNITENCIVVAHVSTYPPRECGLALYTKALVENMSSDRFIHVVLAVDDGKPRYQYNHSVDFVISANKSSDFTEAARFLNQSQSSVVSLQHEYGIFGGDWGRCILGMTSSLRKPLITTFHTILSNPPQLAKETLVELASTSKYVVVTLRKAARLLTDVYGIPESKVRIIQHGAPLASQQDPSIEKARLGLSGRRIASTVGFLSSSKGIEYALRALKILVRDYPDLLYVIVGETHPSLKREEGEAYRRRLKDVVNSLGLDEHVVFVNRFVSEEELATFLNISDVYVAPYRGRDQVSSGTLTRALASGKAVVATPTLFAKETLTSGRGLFCEFDDGKSIARQVRRILSSPTLKRELEVRARRYGKRIGWQKAAEKYSKIFVRAVEAKNWATPGLS